MIHSTKSFQLALAQTAEAHPLLRRLTLVIGGAFLTALAAKISIPLPFTPVPMTLQTFAVFVIAGLLPMQEAFASMLLYLVLGAVGVPVFALHATGTLGYLIAFPFTAGWIALTLRHLPTQFTTKFRVLSTWMVFAIGSLFILALGTLGLQLTLKCSLAEAIQLGVTPFLLDDMVKVSAAALLVRVIK